MRDRSPEVAEVLARELATSKAESLKFAVWVETCNRQLMQQLEAGMIEEAKRTAQLLLRGTERRRRWLSEQR